MKAEMFQADGQRDMAKANSRVSQIRESTQKRIVFIISAQKRPY